MENDEQLLEKMRDNFACWFINNKDKQVKVLNENIDESKIVKLEELNIPIDIEFGNVIYFNEGIGEIELAIKTNDIVNTYIIETNIV